MRPIHDLVLGISWVGFHCIKPSCYIMDSCPRCFGAVAELAIEFPGLMVLRDVNLPSLGTGAEAAQEYMAVILTVYLSWFFSKSDFSTPGVPWGPPQACTNWNNLSGNVEKLNSHQTLVRSGNGSKCIHFNLNSVNIDKHNPYEQTKTSFASLHNFWSRKES